MSKPNFLFEVLVAIASSPIPVTEAGKAAAYLNVKKAAIAAIAEDCEQDEDYRLLATMSASLARGFMLMPEEKWDDDIPPDRNEIICMSVRMARGILKEIREPVVPQQVPSK